MYNIADHALLLKVKVKENVTKNVHSASILILYNKRTVHYSCNYFLFIKHL
jgi:hypothetical protein